MAKTDISEPFPKVILVEIGENSENAIFFVEPVQFWNMTTTAEGPSDFSIVSHLGMRYRERGLN